MSGGHFYYNQYHIRDIAERIEDIIYRNGSAESGFNFEEETILRFREAVNLLNRAYIYARRIDWLVSGDDGEMAFRARLAGELARLPQENEA